MIQAYAADGLGEKGSSWGQDTKIVSARQKKKKRKEKTEKTRAYAILVQKMFEIP
jgi:hypothetical protein